MRVGERHGEPRQCRRTHVWVGGLLTLVAGIGIGLVGDRTKRRFTTWAGAAAAAFGTLTVALDTAHISRAFGSQNVSSPDRDSSSSRSASGWLPWPSCSPASSAGRAGHRSVGRRRRSLRELAPGRPDRQAPPPSGTRRPWQPPPPAAPSPPDAPPTHPGPSWPRTKIVAPRFARQNKSSPRRTHDPSPNPCRRFVGRFVRTAPRRTRVGDSFEDSPAWIRGRRPGDSSEESLTRSFGAGSGVVGAPLVYGPRRQDELLPNED